MNGAWKLESAKKYNRPKETILLKENYYRPMHLTTERN